MENAGVKQFEKFREPSLMAVPSVDGLTPYHVIKGYYDGSTVNSISPVIRSTS